MKLEGLLTVVEVSRRTGLSRKALRLYESRGLVEPAARSPSGYRLYDAAALRRIEAIRRAKLLGLKLSEIKELLHVADGCCGENHPELARLVGLKLAETEERMSELRQLHETLSDVLERLDAGKDGEHRCDDALCACRAPVAIASRR